MDQQIMVHPDSAILISAKKIIYQVIKRHGGILNSYY